MSRAALPGPFRRLLRQPLRAGAIALLAVTALAASGIQNAAAAALRETVDENWRGAYDILVTPDDAMDAIDWMLPPNTLASTETGLTLDDVAAVRNVDGVEVAAPIGEILVPALRLGSARVAIPRGFVGADDEPQAFRVTETYTTDDGLGERVVSERIANIVVDEADHLRPEPDPTPCLEGESRWGEGNYLIDPELYPTLARFICTMWTHGDGVTVMPANATGTTTWNGDSDWLPREPVLQMQLPSTVQTLTRLTLVDPVAERALLGEAGRFLDPLVAVAPVEAASVTVSDLETWARGDDSGFGRRFLDNLAQLASIETGTGYPPQVLAEIRRMYTDNGGDWDAEQRDAHRDVPYAPVLVGDAPVADLSLKIDVEAFGSAPAATDEREISSYALPEALTSGEPGTPVGSSFGDVSGLLNPFSSSAPALSWPGADVATADALPRYDIVSILSTGDVAAAAFATDGGAIRWEPAGYSTAVSEGGHPDDVFRLAANPATPGAEAAYAAVEPAWSLFDSGGGQSIAAVPVGSFDPSTIDEDATAASYVPLGAYAPIGSTLLTGDHAGTTMQPGLTGLGLVSARTAAIASLASTTLWDDDTPVSAIRVRVGGIAGYTAEARERVIAVAQAIDDLGYSVAIMAGSSPADVAVQVDAYAFGTMDAGATQSVGPLGSVTQRWSELGAAARVSLSVSTATLAILGIALAAGILLLGAVQLAGIPGRREQAVVLREMGFTRPRIARWFAAEEVPGLLIVVAVGATAWLVSGGTGTAAVAGLAAVATVIVTSIAAVAASARVAGVRTARDARSRRLGARSVTSFGIRQALAHPLASAVQLVAIVIVGLSAAALVAALLEGRAAAGSSSLALLTVGRQLLPQLVLGAVGVAAGILLARLTRRIDLTRRGDQWALLRAAGWTSGQLATAQRAEGLTVAVPALALTAAAAWGATTWLGLSDGQEFVVVACSAALFAALLVFTTRRKAMV